MTAILKSNQNIWPLIWLLGHDHEFRGIKYSRDQFSRSPRFNTCASQINEGDISKVSEIKVQTDWLNMSNLGCSWEEGNTVQVIFLRVIIHRWHVLHKRSTSEFIHDGICMGEPSTDWTSTHYIHPFVVYTEDISFFLYFTHALHGRMFVLGKEWFSFAIRTLSEYCSSWILLRQQTTHHLLA